METTEEYIIRHLMDAEFALFELRNALDGYCFDELASKVEAFRQELAEEIKKAKGYLK